MTTGYLIDTDIISNLLRRSPSLALVRHLASVDAQNQFTSSVTLGELVYGAHRVADRTASLLQRIDAVLGADLPVLPFDASAAKRYGELRARLERAGTPIGDADVRIASIALVKDLVVVTGNVRHFGVVPDLRVEDWLT